MIITHDYHSLKVFDLQRSLHTKLTRMQKRRHAINSNTGRVSAEASPISTGAIVHTTREERWEPSGLK
jgi:hypothetical protein